MMMIVVFLAIQLNFMMLLISWVNVDDNGGIGEKAMRREGERATMCRMSASK